jgi:hypothetical protein
MQTIEQILGISSDAAFEQAALELFRFQSRACPPYAEYISHIGINPDNVRRAKEIPFLPIELFKSREVYCGAAAPEIVFTSSNTGGTQPSRHYMAHKSDYEQTFTRAFELFCGAPADISVYALLPGYLEREGSSLIYMIDNLVKKGRGGGFYLRDHDKLMADMQRDKGRKLLFGVSYALWDLAEHYPTELHDTIVMETGGMKGRREELPKEEFHAILQNAFGVEAIWSEYGMAELSSQAYSRGGGIFRTPPWMRVSVRDVNDPFTAMSAGRSGGANITDLANRFSCAFIQTQDIATVYADGSFRISGRIDRSEIRGCNLLV